MPKALWNGVVLADAPEEAVETVEGNVYFPMQAVREEFLQPSDHTTVCHWKGKANYYHVVVDGKTNENAAWIYRDPFAAARLVANRVAFWRGVVVEA